MIKIGKKVKPFNIFHLKGIKVSIKDVFDWLFVVFVWCIDLDTEETFYKMFEDLSKYLHDVLNKRIWSKHIKKRNKNNWNHRRIQHFKSQIFVCIQRKVFLQIDHRKSTEEKVAKNNIGHIQVIFYPLSRLYTNRQMNIKIQNYKLQ